MSVRRLSHARRQRALPEHYTVGMATRGDLEQRILELLWVAGSARSVADVHADLTRERELAYTTVMTVLDRLAKKGLVERELVGRAWSYTPADTQPVFVAKQMLGELDGLPPQVRDAALEEFERRVAELRAVEPGAEEA